MVIVQNVFIDTGHAKSCCIKLLHSRELLLYLQPTAADNDSEELRKLFKSLSNLFIVVN